MTHLSLQPHDQAIIGFVRSRLNSYFPHIKRVKYFHFESHQGEYFTSYTIFINNKLTPLLEVKVTEVDAGREYLDIECENLKFLKSLKAFDSHSVQSPLEQFQIGKRTCAVYTYLSGTPVVSMSREEIAGSLLPWLKNFHTSTLLWLDSPEELVERLLNYYRIFFIVKRKELLFFEKVHTAFAKMVHRCPACMKHDDFDFENLVLNGDKLRVKNFYYPLVHKFPLGEITYLYHRYYSLMNRKKRGFPSLFSSRKKQKSSYEIDPKFYALTRSYCEELQIERWMIPYLTFLHWVDYANTISWELLHLSADHKELWEKLSDKGDEGKKEYWQKVAPEVAETELRLQGGVASIISDYMHL